MSKEDQVEVFAQQVEQAVKKDNLIMSLQELLSQDDVQMMELFSIEGIQQKIKNKLDLFVEFCLKHQQFAINLINVGIKCPIHEGPPAQNNMKKICYIASDILTCDHDAISNLFIRNQSHLQTQTKSEEDNEIYQEINQLEEHENHIEILTFQEKFKYLNCMLSYLKQSNVDENCLNYLTKSLSCVIRKKINQLYQLLKQQPWILTTCFKLTHHTSICNFLVKILAEDEADGQYKDIKIYIIQSILRELRSCIESPIFMLKFDFIDELFRYNNYSSNQSRSELQIMSDVIVEASQMRFYISHMLRNDQSTTMQSHINSVIYLTLVVKRMNQDEQPEMESYNTQRTKQATLNYYYDDLFDSFDKIVGLLDSKLSFNRQQYQKNAIQRARQYTLELLYLMSSNSYFRSMSKHLKQSFIILMVLI